MTEYEELRESMQYYENEHYNNLHKHGELLKKIKGNIENHADRKQYGYFLGRDVIEHLATDIIEDLQIDKLTARLEKAESENKELRAELDIIDAANIALHGALEQAEAKLKEAITDMKVMALAMRESEELSESCCFACICENLPDNCILPYGECPGYDKTNCFEWRRDGGGDG